MTTTTRVDENGQIVLPRQILDALHVRVGDVVELTLQEDGAVRVEPKRRRASEVCGMLKSRTSVESTLEEMDRAVADAFRSGDL